MNSDLDAMMEEIAAIENKAEENTDVSYKKQCPAENLPDKIAQQIAKSLNNTIKQLSIVEKNLLLGSEKSRNKQLYQALSLLTRAQISVREGILGDRDDGYFDRAADVAELQEIKVIPVENGIIRLVLPPLASKKYVGSYNIYKSVKLALQAYQEKHGRIDVIGKKLIIIYKRFTPYFGLENDIDNDNWESKRVTNAITEAIEYSDNTAHLSMFYTTSRSNESRVEVTLIEQQSLPFFENYVIQK